MYAKVSSFGVSGIGGFPVSVEVNISNGLPAFDVVGLPDTAVKESRERVRAAIKNNGYRFPVSRLTVNLAPADKKKAGTVYDLPMLVGILAASGAFSAGTKSCLIPARSAAMAMGSAPATGRSSPVSESSPRTWQSIRSRRWRSSSGT